MFDESCLDLTRELRQGTTSARVALQRGGWWMQQRIDKLRPDRDHRSAMAWFDTPESVGW
jgi:hypothetical protein